jgi:hypothetical protein
MNRTAVGLTRASTLFLMRGTTWMAGTRLRTASAGAASPAVNAESSIPHAVFAAFNPSRRSTASRIMNFWILPVTVMGNSSTKST